MFCFLESKMHMTLVFDSCVAYFLFVNMNTNARGKFLPCFLAKIVSNLSTFSVSPLRIGWYGFLPNQGYQDRQLDKPQPFVFGLESISQKFGNLGENFCTMGWLVEFAWKKPALYGEATPYIRIHMCTIFNSGNV